MADEAEEIEVYPVDVFCAAYKEGETFTVAVTISGLDYDHVQGVIDALNDPIKAALYKALHISHMEELITAPVSSRRDN